VDGAFSHRPLSTSLPLSHAIAQALDDAGVKLATHVPGFGAIQTFEAFCEITKTAFATSFHEEAAFGVAHGAAIAGMRSAVIIKSHGLAKAMNAVMDSLSAGVTAGLVILVFEDPSGSHSDNIMDIQPLIKGAGLPYRIGDASTAYEDILASIEESEHLQLPCAIIFNADDINEMSTFESRKLAAPPKYKRDIMQRLVVPLFAEYQHEVLSEKVSDQDWKQIPRPPLPNIPDGLPPDYQRAIAPYQPLFESFRDIPHDFVTGDAGVSTLSALPPYDIVHTATYMGGSVPLAIGAALAGFKDTWAFTGDFSFIAAGHIGLLECVLRQASLKVIVFVNDKAQTTGGQLIPEGMLARVVGGYQSSVIRLTNPHDAALTRKVLLEASQLKGLCIVLADFTNLQP
jgi:TPP-dependent indolepyruvate ferredoxin oxidoreductase alpha subunit